MKQKNKLHFIIMILILLTISSNINAQEETRNPGKFGIGVSIFNFSDFVLIDGDLGYSNSFYFPIAISDKFRLEPEIGFIIADAELLYNIGLGIFGLSVKNNLLLSYGLRIGAFNTEYYHISPTIGTEYLFTNQFSIGAQFQIFGLIDYGELIALTNASVFFRFYFKN